MNKFVCAAIALGGLTQAAGCVFTSAEGELDFAWEVDGLHDYGDGCAELGATGVEVVTRRLSDGDTEIDVFDCGAANVVVSRPLGDYDVWVNAIDDDDLLGQSEIVEVEIVSSSDFIEIPVLGFMNGQFDATWLLTEEPNTAVTCGEVGVGGISVLTTLAGSGGTGFDDIFDCPSDQTEGTVTTAPLPLGDYTVDVSVLDAQTEEALSEPVIKDGTIAEHATVVDLGVFEFLF